MTSVPDAPPRLDQCEAIARLIHATAVAARQQYPHLLTKSGLVWLQSDPVEAQPTVIAALLAHHTDTESLRRAVDHLLDQLFGPRFPSTKAYGQVIQRVQQILTPLPLDPAPPPPSDTTPIPAEGEPSAALGTASAEVVADAPTASLPQDGPNPSLAVRIDPTVPWSGLLLVDAENMNPPAALEAHLQSLAHYPLRYRLAFGNWRTLGNRDQEFYRRGYQMIHVPSGKNSADIKMSLDASLISLHHPSIREVFICSADSDLLHLGHALLRQGMIPYQVSHNPQGFKVFNLAQQTTHTIALPSESGEVRSPSAAKATPHIPTSPAQMKHWLRILILQEQQANPGQPVTVGRLGALFRERNHIGPNQILQTSGDYATLTQLLEADDTFVLTPAAEGNGVYVALKLPSPEGLTALLPKPDQPFAGPITDAQSLEQAILSVLPSLIAQPGGLVSLSVLSSTFAQVYQQPMNQTLQSIGEPKGLPKFLAKCTSIRLQRKGKDWQVGLALPG
ncbi:NYN domain-containing protein [Leptolyngbya sp. BL0902]|uniref:NYN domain-containing protein n=1 Tax=Leptolyngbya sp. BL0902 TaxID=1115757 RepID=UPI0018E8AE5D|nr:NYN domain-containing protein [Leptolyngbya sp. BL0902]